METHFLSLPLRGIFSTWRGCMKTHLDTGPQGTIWRPPPRPGSLWSPWSLSYPTIWGTPHYSNVFTWGPLRTCSNLFTWGPHPWNCGQADIVGLRMESLLVVFYPAVRTGFSTPPPSNKSVEMGKSHVGTWEDFPCGSVIDSCHQSTGNHYHD